MQKPLLKVQISAVMPQWGRWRWSSTAGNSYVCLTQKFKHQFSRIFLSRYSITKLLQLPSYGDTGNQFLFVAVLPSLTQRIIYRDEIQLYELSFGITGKMSQAGNLTLKNACCYRTDVIAIPIKSQKRVGDDMLNLIFQNINAKLES